MKYYKIALEFDINGNIPKAIEFYEKSVNNKETKNSIINLLIIYWLITFDLGFRQEYGIEERSDIYLKSYKKTIELKSQAIEEYPDDVEIIFWIRYINHINGEKDFSFSECEELIRKDVTQLIPYFFVVQYSEKYIPQATKLYESIMNQPSIKNKYIISLIERFLN